MERREKDITLTPQRKPDKLNFHIELPRKTPKQKKTSPTMVYVVRSALHFTLTYDKAHPSACETARQQCPRPLSGTARIAEKPTSFILVEVGFFDGWTNYLSPYDIALNPHFSIMTRLLRQIIELESWDLVRRQIVDRIFFFFHCFFEFGSVFCVNADNEVLVANKKQGSTGAFSRGMCYLDQ